MASEEVGGGQRWLGPGLIALGIGLAVNSFVGPFVADWVDYPVSETMRNQTIGLDAATLLAVAPIAIVVGVLTMRGHRAGPVLALGPTSFGAYMLVQYIAGPDHLTYPRVLLLQLVLFAASWLLAGVAWNAARRSGDDRLGRWHGWVALAMGGFVLLRYVPGLVGSLTNEPIPDELAGDPAMYWLIVLLDLGVFVPVAALAAVGLRRERPWAALLHRGMVGWFTLVTVAVAAMSMAMNLNDDPYASPPQLGLFLVVGLATAGYAAVVLRPLFGPAPSSVPDGGLRTPPGTPAAPSR